MLKKHICYLCVIAFAGNNHPRVYCKNALMKVSQDSQEKQFRRIHLHLLKKDSLGTILPCIFQNVSEYGCSNVAKLFEKKNYIFKKKICVIFTKILFFSVKIFFFQMKLCIQHKYLYPFRKNLILLKNISLCKNIHSV